MRRAGASEPLISRKTEEGRSCSPGNPSSVSAVEKESRAFTSTEHVDLINRSLSHFPCLVIIEVLPDLVRTILTANWRRNGRHRIRSVAREGNTPPGRLIYAKRQRSSSLSESSQGETVAPAARPDRSAGPVRGAEPTRSAVAGVANPPASPCPWARTGDAIGGCRRLRPGSGRLAPQETATPGSKHRSDLN